MKQSTAPRNAHNTKGIWLVLALFVVLGAVYSVKTPAFETPDEIWHFAFVHHLHQGQGLPVSAPNTQALWQQQGVQAPAYYLVAAGLTAWIDTSDFPQIFARANPHRAIGRPDAAINRNYLLPYAQDGFPWEGTFLALHITRLFSVLLGAVTLWATYRALCLIIPVRAALFGTAAFAFIPQFIFISAAASNDNAVNALAALVLWRVTALVMQSPAPGSRTQQRDFLILGLLLGLAALTKLSALGLVGVAGLAVLGHAWERRAWPVLLQATIWIGGPVLVVAGWWYARNGLLYGDLLAWNVWQANILLRVEPAGMGVILAELGSLERSFWGLFGWMNIAYPEMVYSFFQSVLWMTAIGLVVGGVTWIRRSRGRPRFDRRFWAGALLLIWLVVLAVSWVRFMQIAPAAQGRYFHPGAPGIAMLLGLGLVGWRLWTLPWVAILALLVFSAVTPWWIIQPVYTPAASHIAIQPESEPGPWGPLEAVHVVAANGFTIRGVHTWPQELRPGDAATVTIEWEAPAQAPTTKDYSVFIHLVDDEGLTIAQLDTVPGGGLLPTSQWPPGMRYIEQYTVYIPPTAYTPNRATWAIGLYGGDYRPHVGPIDGGRVAATWGESAPESEFLLENDALLLASDAYRVHLHPPEGQAPNALQARFEGGMWLEGYTLSNRVLTPGETLEITLYWRSETVPQQAYTVFVHLLDEALDGVGGEDRTPDRSTLDWQPDTVYIHEHRITIPPQLPPGFYRLAVGMYSTPGFSRLALVDPGRALGASIQAEGADRYLLGPLRVTPEAGIDRARE